ncbi:protein kinase [Streptomyces sp. M10(2022)]
MKVIRPEFGEDAEFRRRFQQEVQAAQRVQGLYTAPVIDSDTDSGRPWLATAYVPGPSLAAAVGEHGPLPVPTVLLLIAGMAEALHIIHGAGIVHRDLKPSNVLLAADGPRVIDFGIARAADATSLTGSGVTIGTPAFMSPEQASGRPVTAATDIFALGLVAAYAATGAPAFGEGRRTGAVPDRARGAATGPGASGVEGARHPLSGQGPEDRPSIAEVIDMCSSANSETQLRRPEDWLPRAVAADITVRAAAPAPDRTPPPRSSPRPRRSPHRPPAAHPPPTAPVTVASQQPTAPARTAIPPSSPAGTAIPPSSPRPHSTSSPAGTAIPPSSPRPHSTSSPAGTGIRPHHRCTRPAHHPDAPGRTWLPGCHAPGSAPGGTSRSAWRRPWSSGWAAVSPRTACSATKTAARAAAQAAAARDSGRTRRTARTRSPRPAPVARSRGDRLRRSARPRARRVQGHRPHRRLPPVTGRRHRAPQSGITGDFAYDTDAYLISRGH